MERKTKQILELLVKSEAFNSLLRFDKGQWEQFLSRLSDQQLDDLLLILDEEASMLREIDKEAARKHKVNETRLRQRFEQRHLEAEQLKKTK